MRKYSVVNDRTHTPSTGCVQNKHRSSKGLADSGPRH